MSYLIQWNSYFAATHYSSWPPTPSKPHLSPTLRNLLFSAPPSQILPPSATLPPRWLYDPPHRETSWSSECVPLCVICPAFIVQSHFYQFIPDLEEGMFWKLETHLFVLESKLRQFYVNFIAVIHVKYSYIYIERPECI